MNYDNKNSDIRTRQLEMVRQAAASELHSRTQSFTSHHAQNVERIRQQVMAEGEAAHNRMKEGYKQEAHEQLQTNTEEAQRRIQQAQQQAQQEARQYVGSVFNHAGQAHINKLREEQIQNRTGRETNKQNRNTRT